jgi:hypothetical protein
MMEEMIVANYTFKETLKLSKETAITLYILTTGHHQVSHLSKKQALWNIYLHKNHTDYQNRLHDPIDLAENMLITNYIGRLLNVKDEFKTGRLPREFLIPQVWSDTPVVRERLVERAEPQPVEDLERRECISCGGGEEYELEECSEGVLCSRCADDIDEGSGKRRRDL